MIPGGRGATGLTLLSVGTGLLLGGLSLGLGLAAGASALWGFGAAWLLLLAPSLSLALRIREGFGNRGLERERRTLRASSHLLRLLALGLALTAGANLMGARSPQPSLPGLLLTLLSVAVLAGLAWAKRPRLDTHPALALDAARTRTLLELAGLALLGGCLGHWFLWADGAAGLALALHLFLGGNALARATTLQADCGGCGGGCH